MNQLTQAALVNNRILSILAAATGPLSALDLYDKPEVREIVADRNKVSMVLSDMWRAGRLTRVPCVVPGSQIKFAYETKPDAKAQRASPTPKVKVHQGASPLAAGEVKVKAKPHITVTEHRVIIELDTIRITVEV